MTIRNIIDAARAGNAVEFERNFQAVVSEKLTSALQDARRQVYSSALGIQETVNIEEPAVGEED